jgi:hypothetical protein
VKSTGSFSAAKTEFTIVLSCDDLIVAEVANNVTNKILVKIRMVEVNFVFVIMY